MEKRGILPPTYFLICLLLSIVIHFVLPLKKFINFPYNNYLGVLLMGTGIWLNIWADLLFKVRRTTVKPFEKSTHLIENGPYRLSRNPMYLGLVVILLGVATLLGSIAPFIVAIIFAIIADRVFISIEEKYLEEIFGQKFLDYKKRIRRWL